MALDLVVWDCAGAPWLVEVVDGDRSLVDPDHLAPSPADVDGVALGDVVWAADLRAGLLELIQHATPMHQLVVDLAALGAQLDQSVTGGRGCGLNVPAGERVRRSVDPAGQLAVLGLQPLDACLDGSRGVPGVLAGSGDLGSLGGVSCCLVVLPGPLV